MQPDSVKLNMSSFSSDLMYEETNSSSLSVSSYFRGSSGKLAKHSRSGKHPGSGVYAFFRNVFLPSGFPDSVSPDYLQYQLWDTVQAFASSISGSLATQAVLKGVGVGDETATALAATITWLLRHGAGMMGQILFTWVQGSSLDHDCKKWRLFADFLNDGAMLIELCAPLCPDWSIQVVLCSAGVARSLVGVCGGATRAAITQHQARQNNISDVAAKDGSQETLVNLVALLMNLFLLPMLSEDLLLTWAVFLLMTFLHLYANFMGVKALEFSTLNKERFLLNFRLFADNGHVLSVTEANEREAVILGMNSASERQVLAGKVVRVGVSLAEVMDSEPEMDKMLDKLRSEHYHVTVKNNEMLVLLHENATREHIFQAYFDACYMAVNNVEDHDIFL